MEYQKQAGEDPDATSHAGHGHAPHAGHGHAGHGHASHAGHGHASHNVGKQTLTGGLEGAPPRAARTDQERYAAILALAGTTPDAWRHEIHQGTFLGHSVTLHQSMLQVLEVVEARLGREFSGRDPHQIGVELGVTAIESLRPVGNAAGRGVISAHAFGLAIDINEMVNNRFIGMRADRAGRRGDGSRREVRSIDDAMWLIHGEHYNILDAENAHPSNAALHAGYARASEALTAYFALADDRDRLIARMIAVGELTAGSVDAAAVDRRRDGILANRASMRAGNPDHTGPGDGRGDIATDGFFDLDLRLVEAMTGEGLRWGGRFARGKDLMHFDLDRRVTEARRSSVS